MLYIDPDVCIDCGACIDACPVSAITTDYELTDASAPFEEVNAAYYAATASSMDRGAWRDPHFGRRRPDADAETLRVAVVGGGAAGHYVVSELLDRIDVRVAVDVYERLAEPGGLVRYGVAPRSRGHQTGAGSRSTPLAGAAVCAPSSAWKWGATFPTPSSLRSTTPWSTRWARCTGARSPCRAATSRRWRPPPTSWPGTTTTRTSPTRRSTCLTSGWWCSGTATSRSMSRGSSPPIPRRSPAPTMSAAAIDALRASRVREVVVLARRGPEHAAFTIARATRPHPGRTGVRGCRPISWTRQHRDRIQLRRGTTGRRSSSCSAASTTPPHPATASGSCCGSVRHRVRITASDGAARVDFDDHGAPSALECGLVLAAIGLHGTAAAGVPFDEAAGVIPNRDGRVLGDDGAPLPGVYAAGWIKRGPTGTIGTNRFDARGTVDALVTDFQGGALPTPTAAPPESAEQSR